METRQERRRRLDRQGKPQPGDPPATKPAQARTGLAIMVLVLLVAAGLIGAMFNNNTRYDGNSPVPVSEHRR
jgi:hypothetical protein